MCLPSWPGWSVVHAILPAWTSSLHLNSGLVLPLLHSLVFFVKHSAFDVQGILLHNLYIIYTSGSFWGFCLAQFSIWVLWYIYTFFVSIGTILDCRSFDLFSEPATYNISTFFSIWVFLDWDDDSEAGLSSAGLPPIGISRYNHTVWFVQI